MRIATPTTPDSRMLTNRASEKLLNYRLYKVQLLNSGSVMDQSKICRVCNVPYCHRIVQHRFVGIDREAAVSLGHKTTILISREIF